MNDRADHEALLRVCGVFYRCVSFVGWMLAAAGAGAVMVAAGVSPGAVAVGLVALAFAGVIAADVGGPRSVRPAAPPRDQPATPWPAGNTTSGSAGSFPRG